MTFPTSWLFIVLGRGAAQWLQLLSTTEKWLEDKNIFGTNRLCVCVRVCVCVRAACSFPGMAPTESVWNVTAH